MGDRHTVRFSGVPADLLPLVFAKPREAVAGARALLADRPNPYDASFAHQVLGLVEREYGDGSAAVKHLRRAAMLARRAGSVEREGDVLATLGVALVYNGRTAAGLSALADAVTKTRGLAAARVRLRRGGALRVLGRHDDALAEIRQALPVLRRTGDTIWIARALTVRALTNLALGATERADRDFDEAERLYSTTEQAHEAAVMVHNRGIVALRAGDLPAALALLDEAAQRYGRLGTPSAELSLDRCGVLLAAGLAGEAHAEADAAIQRLDRRRGQATWRAELLVTAARAALAAGDALTGQQRATAAARAFAAQRREWWSVHTRLLVLQARFFLGTVNARLVGEAAAVAGRLTALGSDEAAQAHLLAGRAALALRRFAVADRQLATAASARRHGPALAQVTGWLAEALRAEASGSPQQTLDACRRGMRVLQQHRLTLGASELRAQATAHGSELMAVGLRASLGDARALFVWAEQWRASALAAPPVRPPDDRHMVGALARYRDITSRLETERSQALQQERLRAERAVRAAAMRTGANGGQPGTDRSLDVARLMAELGGTRLVELLDVGGQLHVLVCGRGTIRRFVAGATAEATTETDHACAALRRLAHHAAPRPDETVQILSRTGQELQRLLLGPATDHLGDGPLVIVPPSHLHAVPWALLPALFARTHEVAPSARTWLRARTSTPPPAGRVILVRGPGLSAKTDEVAALARLYRQSTILRDGDATAARVLDALDGSALAHLAAHGTFRADSPLLSSLRMADGPLTVYDFERLRRAPHRLVLPSCDSARLATAGSDELLGLAAALLPLGTAGIVGSVVPVNDDATAAPMLALHQGLQRGLRMAEALRDARIGAGRDPLSLAVAWSFVAFGAG